MRLSKAFFSAVLFLSLASLTHAAPKIAYDIQKIQAILSSPEITTKFISLDGIILQKSDEKKRILEYHLISGQCKTTAILSWSEDFDPKYKVVSIGNTFCP